MTLYGMSFSRPGGEGGPSSTAGPFRSPGPTRLDRALLATGFPYDIRERLPETLARLGRMVGVAQGVRRAGSAALDMCYVACGRFDGFWEENLKPWDTAAGLLHYHRGGGEDYYFQRRRLRHPLPQYPGQ